MTGLEIREQILRYIDGDVSAPDLEDWLENGAWDEDGIEPPARALVQDALRVLAEHANDDWTEDELKDRLGQMARTYWFEQAPKITLDVSSASVTHRHELVAAAGGPVSERTDGP